MSVIEMEQSSLTLILYDSIWEQSYRQREHKMNLNYKINHSRLTLWVLFYTVLTTNCVHIYVNAHVYISCPHYIIVNNNTKSSKGLLKKNFILLTWNLLVYSTRQIIHDLLWIQNKQHVKIPKVYINNAKT